MENFLSQQWMGSQVMLFGLSLMEMFREWLNVYIAVPMSQDT